MRIIILDNITKQDQIAKRIPERLVSTFASALREVLPLVVMSVFRESSGLNANAGGALEKLFECAKKYDAQMNIYFNNSPALVVAVASKKLGAVNLVTGFPEEGSSGFIASIHEILPELPITMVDKNSNEYRMMPSLLQSVH